MVVQCHKKGYIDKMVRKYWIFLGMMFCLLLTGCNETIKYNPDLFKPDQASCWPCQMYMMAFHAIANLLEGSLALVCSNSLKVLTLALPFWLMFKVSPWVISLSPPNFKEDFVGIIKVLFKAMIVALFLAHPDYFYTEIGAKVLQPIGNVFLKLSEFVITSPSSVGVNTQYSGSQNTFLSGLMDWRDAIMGAAQDVAGSASKKAKSLFGDSKLSDIFSSIESAFSRTVLPSGREIIMPSSDRMFGALPMQIQSVVWQIYSALWSGMGLVFQLFQSNYFAAWLAGIVLAGALFFLLICLPLSFVDAFMRLGIGVILMPIFMVVWVFPIKTFEGIGKKLVELILSAFFDILFNCIYVAFLISVLQVYVKEKIPHLFSTDYQVSESKLRESGLQLSWDFLVMFVLVYTVFKLSSKVDEMTSQFFSAAGQGTSIRQSMMKILTNSAKLTLATGLAVGRACIGDFSGFANVAKQAKGMAGDMVMEGVENMNAEQTKSGGEDNWTN